MADIAELGFAIESAPLLQGSAALDRLTAAADRAERAATRTVVANDNVARSLTRAERAANMLRDTQGRFISSANAAAAANDNVARSAHKVEDATTRMNRSAVEGEAVWSRLQSAMAWLSAFVGARALQQMADTWSDLNARIGLAVRDMDASGAVLDRLSDVARRTYSDLSLTAESFIRNATVLRELGKSTREQLDFTDSLNLALVVSGAKADRAAQVQEALGRAMAIGKLAGQELNTVIQTGGRVAELLAEELGIGVNQLRQYGAQGKITGDVIYNALTKNMEKLREEAEKMPATIGDAFTLLRNAVLRFVGVFDQANKISESFAQTLIMLADNINILAGAAAAAGVLALAAALRVATTATIAFTTALAVNPLGLIAVALSTAIGLLVAYKDKFVQIGDVTTTGATIMNAAWATITNAAMIFVEVVTTGYEVVRKLFNKDWSGIGSTLEGSWERLKKLAEGVRDAWLTAMQWGIDESSSPLTDPRWGGTIDLDRRGKATNAPTDAQIKAAESYKKIVDAARQSIQMQEIERQGLFMTEQAAKALRYEQELLNKAANDNITLTPRQKAELQGLAHEMAAAEVETSHLKAAMDFAKGTVQGFFSDFNQGLRNGEGVWKSFANAAMNALNRISDKLMQMAVDNLWNAALPGMGGGGGGILGALFGGAKGSYMMGGVSVPIFHGGGVIGLPGAARFVPPNIFVGANHFRTGGIPGLGPDEVPIIAHRNEEVVRRDDPRHRYNGGAGGGDTFQYVDNRTFNDVTPDVMARIEARMRAERPQIIAAAIAEMRRMRGRDPNTFGPG